MRTWLEVLNFRNSSPLHSEVFNKIRKHGLLDKKYLRIYNLPSLRKLEKTHDVIDLMPNGNIHIYDKDQE